MNKSPEERAKTVATVVKVGTIVVVGLIAVPIVGLAIKGLIGLCIAGAIGFGAMAVAPVLGMKAQNWKLKQLKAEANKNPVETLQAVYLERQHALEEGRQKIETFSMTVNTFSDKVEGFKRQYPDEAPKFAGQLAEMRKLLKLRQTKYQEAKAAQVTFAAEIEKADAIWKMGQAAAEANKGSGMSDEDFYAQLKVNTSMDSVQNSLNLAFAGLETSLLDEEPTMKLPNKAAPVAALK